MLSSNAKERERDPFETNGYEINREYPVSTAIVDGVDCPKAERTNNWNAGLYALNHSCSRWEVVQVALWKWKIVQLNTIVCSNFVHVARYTTAQLFSGLQRLSFGFSGWMSIVSSSPSFQHSYGWIWMVRHQNRSTWMALQVEFKSRWCISPVL